MTAMTTAPTSPTSTDLGAFTRPWLLISTGAVALNGALQFVGSRSHPDPVVRDTWLQDLTATLVVAAVAALLSYTLAVWALRGGSQRHTRAVAGLSVFAILLTPLLWFSAAPVIVAAAAILLGVATGATRRHGQRTAARSLALVAGLCAVAALAVTVGGTIAEAL
jgi:hypothetical protein